MSYSFRKSDRSLTQGLRRIARSQIEMAIAEIDDPELDPVTTAHQLRKRCKKLRGLIRLVRPGFNAYEEENATFRDLARSLADLRDAGATLETVGALEKQFGEVVGTEFFAGVRKTLAAASPPPHATIAQARLRTAREAFAAALERTGSWQIRGKPADILAHGAAMTYKRALKAMSVAAETDMAEDFHEYRKWVKYHWYQMRVLKQIWPKIIHARIEEARRLADELGNHHDFAVFRMDVLPTLEWTDKRVCEVLGGLIEAEELRLEPRCLKQGRRLFAEDSKGFGQRVGAYWKAWRN